MATDVEVCFLSAMRQLLPLILQLHTCAVSAVQYACLHEKTFCFSLLNKHVVISLDVFTVRDRSLQNIH